MQGFSSTVKIRLSSALCLLFKDVQDIDAFGELRDIKDPMLNLGVNSDLLHAGSDGRHWLPIIRLESELHQVQLMASELSSVLGELAQVVERRAHPEEVFGGHAGNIQNYVYTVKPLTVNFEVQHEGLRDITFLRRAVAEALAWTLVQLRRDAGAVALGYMLQADALGEIDPYAIHGWPPGWLSRH